MTLHAKICAHLEQLCKFVGSSACGNHPDLPLGLASPIVNAMQALGFNEVYAVIDALRLKFHEVKLACAQSDFVMQCSGVKSQAKTYAEQPAHLQIRELSCTHADLPLRLASALVLAMQSFGLTKVYAVIDALRLKT